jgi:ribokinase
LVKHNSFPRKLEAEIWNRLNPKFLYLSSLPEDSLGYHQEISKWLKSNRHTKLVFQPGTFQMKLGIEAMKDFYTNCYLYIVNKEESQYILNTKESSLQILLEKLQKLGPEIVCITDGPNGAYMRAKENGNYQNFFMPIYPDPKPPLERTGCGDAFASTFMAALALGKTPKQALEYAPINSMSVVQEIGAQKGLLTLAEIETYLRNKPDSYKIIEI